MFVDAWHKTAAVFLLASAAFLRCAAGDPVPRFVAARRTPELLEELRRYGLEAGYIAEDGDEPISYLLYVPRGARKARLPMVVCLPGLGEMGSDLCRQFHDRTIFDCVLSAEFQKKHPCFLLSLSPPDGTGTILGGLPGRPSDLQSRLGRAIDLVIQKCGSPAVDRTRLYITGLSFGGNGAYALSFAYPGKFAATLPIAALPMGPEWVSESHPGNWYHFYNSGDYARAHLDSGLLDPFRRAVEANGGEFRVGTYPDEGHNAWKKAWREDAAWDWMFSKSTDRKKGSRAARREPQQVDVSGAKCSSSMPGADAGHDVGHVVDGLDGTAYVSMEPVKKGDFVLVEFTEPLSGQVTVQTGDVYGKGRLSSGRVMVSKNGRSWFRGGTFSRRTGQCSFRQGTKIRFLKILPEPSKAETLTIREIKVMR